MNIRILYTERIFRYILPQNLLQILSNLSW